MSTPASLPSISSVMVGRSLDGLCGWILSILVLCDAIMRMSCVPVFSAPPPLFPPLPDPLPSSLHRGALRSTYP